MFNTYHMILCSLLSAVTSAAVSNILWLRFHRRVRSLLERDLRDLWEEIDTLKEMDEPPRQLTPEEQEVAECIKRYREHPEDYECSYEETDGVLYVTISLKDPEEAPSKRPWVEPEMEIIREGEAMKNMGETS